MGAITVADPVASPDVDDHDLLVRAVADLAAASQLPVAFGGLESAGAVTVTAVVGGRTRSLHGLRILPTRGLGGRAMVEHRPRLTADYATSRQITHDYDTQILGEGISGLMAVPVMVRGATRAVLYGGSRGGSGEVFSTPALEIARSLGTELQIRDEVRRRVAAAAPTGRGALAPAQREHLREGYAELRALAASIDDPALRQRLESIQQHLSAVTADAAAPADVHLTPRETDVLACAALGYTNQQVAEALGVKEGTVKAYLGSAMGKLDASTRHAAVAHARRAGLLP